MLSKFFFLGILFHKIFLNYPHNPTDKSLFTSLVLIEFIETFETDTKFIFQKVFNPTFFVEIHKRHPINKNITAIINTINNNILLT